MKNTINLYLKDIAKYPLLTAEEQKELAQKVSKGNEALIKLNEEGLASCEIENLNKLVNEGKVAKEKIINSNLKLVVSIAKEYKNYNLDLMDLIQEGNFGLAHAVDKFDFTYDNKFSTYASYWIRQNITRSIHNSGRLIRIPNHVRDQISKLNKARYDLEEKLGREATTQELADVMKLDELEITNLMSYSSSITSLDMMVGDGKTALSDFYEADDANPYEKTKTKNFSKDIRNMLAELDSRERFVIERKFGFYDGKSWTLESIGNELHITRERVRQLESKAIKKLRDNKNIEVLLAYCS